MDAKVSWLLVGIDVGISLMGIPIAIFLLWQKWGGLKMPLKVEVLDMWANIRTLRFCTDLLWTLYVSMAASST